MSTTRLAWGGEGRSASSFVVVGFAYLMYFILSSTWIKFTQLNEMIPMFMVSLAAHFPHIHCVNLNQYTWYDDKCMFYHLKFKDMYHSLRPSEAIWQHRSWSTLPQVMGCCLMATSHYVNQCWLIISDYLAGFHRRAVSQWVPKLFSCVMCNEFDTFKVTVTSPRGQWVKIQCLISMG